MPNFEYNVTTQALGIVDIADIGNCAIFAQDTYNNIYYYINKSARGFTSTYQLGPVRDAFGLLPKFAATYNVGQYNPKKITGQLNFFLSDKIHVEILKPIDAQLAVTEYLHTYTA